MMMGDGYRFFMREKRYDQGVERRVSRVEKQTGKGVMAK